MPKSETLKTFYPDYKESTDNPLSYSDYRECCELFNIYVMDRIIDGKRLNMGSYLSTLQVVRVERNYSKPRVNWGETNKYKKELLEEDDITEDDLYSKDNPDGIKYFIYHTDDWYCRFHWHKMGCKVRNKSVYSFHATRGLKGNKTKLKEKLNNNPLQFKKYRLLD